MVVLDFCSMMVVSAVPRPYMIGVTPSAEDSDICSLFPSCSNLGEEVAVCEGTSGLSAAKTSCLYPLSSLHGLERYSAANIDS
jgi:hypothetical protein